MTEPPLVSVILVTYNSSADIESCLDSLALGCQGVPFEVVVVDNASHDDSAQRVRDHAQPARVLEETRNLGFAGACNRAVQAAEGRYILLLNPDAQLEPGCVQALVTFAEANPLRTPLGGRCLDADGRLDPRSCWGTPTLWGTFCQVVGLSRVRSNSRLLNPEALGGWQRDSVADVGVVTGFLLLVQREVWLQLGGLDERYFVYGEDVDFSLRARRSGRRPTITPDAVVTHLGGRSSESSAAKLVLLFAGKVTLMDQHWSAGQARVGKALLRLGVWARAAAGETAQQELWRRRAEWVSGFPARTHHDVTR